MNMPPPPTARAYQKNARTVAKHVKPIAKDSMSNAAKQMGMLVKMMSSTVVFLVMVPGKKGGTLPRMVV